MVSTLAFLVVDPCYRADQHAATVRELGHAAMVIGEAHETPAGTIGVKVPIPAGVELPDGAPHPFVEPEIVVLCDRWLWQIGDDVIRKARANGQIVLADIERCELVDQTRRSFNACDGVVCATMRIAELVTRRPSHAIAWIACTTIDPAGRGPRASWGRILGDVGT